MAIAALLAAVGLIAGLWQPPGGDGWRLLDVRTTGGRPSGVEIATSAAGLRALLSGSGDRGVGEVDFDTEFVVHFAAVASSGSFGCQRTILQGVHIQGATVFGTYRRPWWTTYCNDDARYRGFLVAVRREAVPAGPLTVKLDRDQSCESCEETETVTIR